MLPARTLPTDANLESITAVVIGGTSLFGGRGALLGTLLGALIVGYFRTGLSLAGVDDQWRVLTIGVLVIIAVSDRPVDQKGTRMRRPQLRPPRPPRVPAAPVLSARGLVKTFGRVVGLDGVDFDLYPGEVLAIIGDNGAGQVHADQGGDRGAGPRRRRDHVSTARWSDFRAPPEAREAGIETVYQTLAVAPALDIAANMFLGREMRRTGPLGSVLRMLDHKGMRDSAGQSMADLGIGTLQNMSQAVETLSGGQRQAVAVARAAAFATKLIVLDEPTAALGVKETNQVLSMINRVRENGLPVILISHNMPNVFEVADRIHIQRLGRCAGVVTPQSHTPNEVVAIMTGATTLEETPGKTTA